MISTFDVNVFIDEFECLIAKPFAWQRIMSVSLGVKRGDRIKINEVNSINVATGRIMIGIVKFISSGDMIVSNNKDVVVYCDNVSEFIGGSSVGNSFIVL